jgi:uncharacterized membrane protein YobD (UPF0266 family)
VLIMIIIGNYYNQHGFINSSYYFTATVLVKLYICTNTKYIPPNIFTLVDALDLASNYCIDETIRRINININKILLTVKSTNY